VILSDIFIDEKIQHPLVSKNGSKKELMIVIASHKGLCGSYNSNIYRKLYEKVKHDEQHELTFVTIGKYAEKIAKKLHIPVALSYQHAHFTTKESRSLSKFLVSEYMKGEYGKITVLHTHFASASSFVPKYIDLLPFKSDKGKRVAGESMYEYEPTEETVLFTVIPLMLQNIITSAILESYASEHSARMFAMKSATDNASELQKELKLYYNRARQDAVTQEIAEITSGAMALSN
jgi:F-type H+-transporting ATPase subunit gamma